jgi:hypothetical protein
MNYVVSITDSEWHPVTAWHAEGAPYTLTMLVLESAERIYFAGRRRRIQNQEPGTHWP